MLDNFVDTCIFQYEKTTIFFLTIVSIVSWTNMRNTIVATALISPPDFIQL